MQSNDYSEFVVNLANEFIADLNIGDEDQREARLIVTDVARLYEGDYNDDDWRYRFEDLCDEIRCELRSAGII